MSSNTKTDEIIYFFEMAGQPGVMYLDSFSFGGTAPWGGKWSDEETIQMDGYGTTTYLAERVGPVHIFPAWKSLFHSPLCAVIREASQRKLKLPMCSMGTEVPTPKGSLIKTTKYRFIEPAVMRFSDTKQYGHEVYTISYRDINVF